MTTERPKKIRRTIRRCLSFLIGGQALTLENRLLNSVCLIAIFIMVFNIPFNYFSGLEITSLIFVVFTTFVCFAYYLGRFRQMLISGVIIASGTVILLFSLNYFYSAGGRGASMLSFMLGFVLIIIISPKML